MLQGGRGLRKCKFALQFVVALTLRIIYLKKYQSYVGGVQRWISMTFRAFWIFSLQKSLVRFEAGMEAEFLQAMCGSEQIPTPLGFCCLSAAPCSAPQLGGHGFWAQLLHEQQIH